MSIESVFNGEEVAFRPRFKLKVRLKRTKKLLKINFSSDDQLSRILPPPTKSSPNAGVEANLGLIKRIKVSTSTGLRLNTPAHWYWLLRTRYDVSSFDLGLNIRYTTHNKWILHQYYQQRYGQLSFNSDFSWSESDGVTFSQRVGIQLPEIPLVYYLGLNGVYENAFKNQRTFMEIKYENSLYRKKWLRYSIGVRNQYLRETNWKSEVETFARLDGFFGGS